MHVPSDTLLIRRQPKIKINLIRKQGHEPTEQQTIVFGIDGDLRHERAIDPQLAHRQPS